jgi:hypothetical protein
MSNHTDTLTQLRELLKHSKASLKKCESSYKGFLAFRGNHQGLQFCAAQLFQAAAGLRDDAEQLAAIAEDLATAYSVLAQPEETLDIGMDRS